MADMAAKLDGPFYHYTQRPKREQRFFLKNCTLPDLLYKAVLLVLKLLEVLRI